MLNTAGTAFSTVMAGNGTWVRLIYPDFDLALASAEGAGTNGPITNPLGGFTGPPPAPGTPPPPGGSVHVGYRGGSGLLIGGAIPGTRRFGTGRGGRLYDTIDLTFPPGTSVIAILGSVQPGPRWPQGAHVPVGILDDPVDLGIGSVHGWQHLDVSASFTDMTSLTNSLANDNHGTFHLGVLPGTGPTAFALQALILHPVHGALLTDAQSFQVGL